MALFDGDPQRAAFWGKVYHTAIVTAVCALIVALPNVYLTLHDSIIEMRKDLEAQHATDTRQSSQINTRARIEIVNQHNLHIRRELSEIKEELRNIEQMFFQSRSRTGGP